MQLFNIIDTQVVILYNVKESSVQSIVKFVRFVHFAFGYFLRYYSTLQWSLCLCKISDLVWHTQEYKLILTQFNKVDDFKNTKQNHSKAQNGFEVSDLIANFAVDYEREEISE